MTSYAYDSAYLDRLTSGWNKTSFPIISGLIRKTLRPYHKQILDFGSGAGTYAKTLAESGGKVTACDVSESSIAACHDKYASAFIIKDAADLPAESFDFIFSTEVLEHIQDYAGTIAHLRRALRPNGTLLLTTTCYSSSLFTMLYDRRAVYWRESLRWLAGYFRNAEYRDKFIEQWCFEPLGGHYHGFLRGELLRAFTDAGFTVTKANVFYAIEPLQIHFLYSHTLREVLRQKGLLAASIYLVGHPLNSVLKRFNLFANNIYVVASPTHPR